MIRVVHGDTGPYMRIIELDGTYIYSIDVFEEGGCVGEPTRRVELSRYRMEHYRFGIGEAEAEVVVYVGLAGPQIISVRLYTSSPVEPEEAKRIASEAVKLCRGGQ